MINIQPAEKLTSILKIKGLKNNPRKIATLRGSLLAKLGLIKSKITKQELIIHPHAIKRIKDRLGWKGEINSKKLLEAIQHSPHKWEIGILPEKKEENRRIGIFSKELNIFFAAESHPQHEVIFKTVFNTNDKNNEKTDKKRKEFENFYQNLLTKENCELTKINKEIINNIVNIKAEKICEELVRFTHPINQIKIDVNQNKIYKIYKEGEGLESVQKFIQLKFNILNSKIFNDLRKEGYEFHIKRDTIIFKFKNKATCIKIENINPLLKENNLENLKNFINVMLR